MTSIRLWEILLNLFASIKPALVFFGSELSIDSADFRLFHRITLRSLIDLVASDGVQRLHHQSYQKQQTPTGRLASNPKLRVGQTSG